MSPYRCAGVRSVWNLIYIHNPFYLISACLVLIGCQMSFDIVDTSGHVSWMLMACLAAYTALLACAGCLIIRFGGVWDDARTILLVLVLLFLALATSFDRLLVVNLQAGSWILVLGFAFSVLVSEVVLRTLRIRLPAPWRGPFYLILGLLFAYPIWVAMAIDDATTTREGLAWRILLFSPVASVALLSLLPAARRGRNQPFDNGTPWPWPWFPWSLFVMLAVGVILRMYFLSLSFDPVTDDRPTVQLYFFVPPLAAMFLVALELGVAAGWSRVINRCVMLPAMLPLLAMWTGDQQGNGQVFLDLLSSRAGSPLFLTLWMMAGYYAYAYWSLGLPLGFAGLWIALAALTQVGPSTTDMVHLAPLQWQPLAALTSLHLFLALRWGRSLDWLCTAMLALVLTTVLGRETWIADNRAIVPCHIAIAMLLVIGAIWNDVVGRVARVSGAMALSIACLLALFSDDSGSFSPSWGLASYECGLAIVAATYAYVVGRPVYLLVATINVLVCMIFASWRVVAIAKARPLGEGAGLLAAGGLCLGIAVGISLAKAGYWRRATKWIPWSGEFEEVIIP